MVGNQMRMESSGERQNSERDERVGFGFGSGRTLAGVSVVFGVGDGTGGCGPGELSNLTEEGGGM